jgi:hypothetical protein
MPETKPPRVLYLHIGAQKTGNATLQNLFMRNRELLAKHDLCYPGAPGEPNHAGLMLYAVEHDKNMSLRSRIGLPDGEEAEAFTASLMPRLQAEIEQSGCAKILLSNEYLSAHVTTAKDAQKLVDGLRQICPDIRLVIYLRPQYELVLSAYSQAVKSGRAEAMRVELDEDTQFCNYDMMLSLWEMALGIENIRVRLFRREEFAEGSVIADFFRTIDMEVPEGLELPGTLNPSLDACTLEFVRIANATIPRHEAVDTGPWLSPLLNALERISTGPKYIAASPDLAELDRTFQSSNEKVARRYFPERDGMLFPPYNEIDRPNSPSLTARKVVELTVALWQEATERGIRKKQRRPQAADRPRKRGRKAE